MELFNIIKIIILLEFMYKLTSHQCDSIMLKVPRGSDRN